MATKKTIQLPGGILVTGANDEQQRVLIGRSAFVQEYCAKKGWCIDHLTIAQLLEIRAQDGWKHPKE